MAKERNEEQDTIYLVPNAHFDALWVFTKEEHLYINLMLVLKEVEESFKLGRCVIIEKYK